MQSSVRRRLINGFGGQAASRLLIAVFSLLVIPFMIHSWGLELYGEWVALSAVASYITVSNFGITAASSMAIIGFASSGDFDRSNHILQTSIAAVTVLLGSGALILAALVISLGLLSRFNINHISQLDACLIIAILFAQILGSAYRGLITAVSNSAGSYGVPQYISAALRVVEFAVTLAALGLLKATPVAVASIGALIIALDIVIQVLVARSNAPWFRFGFNLRDVMQLRPLAAASMGHAAISVGVNSIVVQGYRLLISATLGGAAVGIFSIFSTLLRLSEHVTNIVTPVVQLEFARTGQGGDGLKNALSLISLSGGFVLLSSSVISIVLILAGPIIVPLWTLSKVQFDLPLFLIMAMSSMFTQLGRAPLSYLMGRNSTAVVSARTLATSAIGICLATVVAKHWGLPGIASAMLVGEVLSTTVIIYTTAATLGVTAFSLWRGQVQVTRVVQRLLQVARVLP